MSINKYFWIAFIYFFINSLGLPFGLTYTALLSPLFYWWVLVTRKKEIILPFFSILLPYFLIHYYLGIMTKEYIVSLLNLATVYIFCQAFYTFLKVCNDPEKIFRRIVIINFILCLVAVPLYFTPFQELVWIKQYLTAGVNDFLRLKLFTYEASYYATLFTPLFVYFLLKILFKQNKINAWLLLPMLFLPYILSFALGVIISLLMAGTLLTVFYFKKLLRRKRIISLYLVFSVLGIIAILCVFLFFPDNTLFVRLENIISGKDSSSRGRTFEAFFLAGKLLEQKSQAWGIGLGQIKILGTNVIRDYYLYPADYVISIPNAAAETLAIFGWVGLSIRILLEIFLFFYTKVWTNYYRLLLFFFIFIYQFTGSFITNLAEYVIWILVFTNCFPRFDVKQVSNGN